MEMVKEEQNSLSVLGCPLPTPPLGGANRKGLGTSSQMGTIGCSRPIASLTCLLVQQNGGVAVVI